MKTYKLTFPCQFVDIDGNMVDGEHTVMFTNKEELIEYLSGDVNGDNYGSSLLRIREHDIKLYEEVGRMCNHMVNMFEAIAASNITMDAAKTRHGWETEVKPVRKQIRRK